MNLLMDEAKYWEEAAEDAMKREASLRADLLFLRAKLVLRDQNIATLLLKVAELEERAQMKGKWRPVGDDE